MARMNIMKNRLFVMGFGVALALMSGVAAAERIKDITTVAGVRSNQLMGYGLVVGLSGSGDQTTQTPFTVQSLKSMLNQFGITVPQGQNLQVKNVAAVTIHAELPPFAKPGQSIDITVSSIGNAKSLRGGTLLMTPLKGADGNVYALAQGNLVVGGFGADAGDGSRMTVNIPSVGRIPSGATVEREVPMSMGAANSVILNLHQSDFTTANRIAEAVNGFIGAGTAIPLDGTSIRITAPRDASQRVSFLSMLENLQVSPGDAAAKVIVNSRTGTVVIGKHVSVTPAAVAHGSLTVTIAEQPQVSQPEALAQGQTVVATESTITVEEENNRMFLFEPGVSLNQIVQAVNQVGAAPGDLVAILEALKQSGALKAELIII